MLAVRSVHIANGKELRLAEISSNGHIDVNIYHLCNTYAHVYWIISMIIVNHTNKNHKKLPINWIISHPAVDMLEIAWLLKNYSANFYWKVGLLILLLLDICGARMSKGITACSWRSPMADLSHVCPTTHPLKVTKVKYYSQAFKE